PRLLLYLTVLQNFGQGRGPGRSPDGRPAAVGPRLYPTVSVESETWPSVRPAQLFRSCGGKGPERGKWDMQPVSPGLLRVDETLFPHKAAFQFRPCDVRKNERFNRFSGLGNLFRTSPALFAPGKAPGVAQEPRDRGRQPGPP